MAYTDKQVRRYARKDRGWNDETWQAYLEVMGVEAAYKTLRRSL